MKILSKIQPFANKRHVELHLCNLWSFFLLFLQNNGFFYTFGCSLKALSNIYSLFTYRLIDISKAIELYYFKFFYGNNSRF